MTIPAVLLLLWAQQSPKHPDVSWSLRQLGFNAAKAVLTEIYPRLLNYDRSDLRAAHEVSQGEKKSDLTVSYRSHVSQVERRPCRETVHGARTGCKVG